MERNLSLRFANFIIFYFEATLYSIVLFLIYLFNFNSFRKKI